MATYYGTYGQKVQYLASDPSDPQLGQVWYNSTSAVLKVRAVSTTGTFASGGNLNNARQFGTGVGTQTAALVAGGSPNPVGLAEIYNGTSWTAITDLPNYTASGAGGAGTQTSAVVFGGSDGNPTGSNSTREWNGTSWSLEGNLNTRRMTMGGCGTQTAALGFGGDTPPFNTNTTATESYNGSSWTSVNSMNTARRAMGGFGIQTAAIAAGGYTTTQVASTESWNGTSWTSNPTGLNTARASLAGGAGIQTAGLIMGGEAGPGNTGATELWNGSTWTSNPNSMSTVRYGSANLGTQTAGLAAGGFTTVAVTTTEEFTGPGSATTRTVTVS